jgi:HPt (histidine-containing phosphotransfer) domain-containing protein
VQGAREKKLSGRDDLADVLDGHDFMRSSRAIPNGLPAGLTAAYIDHCLHSLPALHAAVHGGDPEALRHFGHKLKGSGAVYGFPVLSEIGALLETAGARDDREELRRQVLRLEEYLNEFEEASAPHGP